jgi:hypothetical protein
MAITTALRELHAMWRHGELAASTRASWTEEFTRAAQAERLVSYLRQVVPSGGRIAASATCAA